MKASQLIFFFLLFFAVQVFAGFEEYFSEEEVQIISGVAEKYELTSEETTLLFAIRKVENGPTGLEFGVGSWSKKHSARRYKNNPKRSLKVQAEWAAGTIIERYRDNRDLVSFSRRYCPPNSVNWRRMVREWMKKLSAEDAD